ncbi:MAG: endonuclease III [Elusimicrobiota bacterium]
MSDIVKKIIVLLEKKYPEAKIALKFSNPLELLAATILSAQSTDLLVNRVTENLFLKYRTLEDYVRASLPIFEQAIRSTGFYHNKAKNIINACKIIKQKFNGQVPKTMEELVTLPGVARKTANIVLSNGYGVVVGIAVDTHVRRLAQRLGLTKNSRPEKIEADLMKIVPEDKWFKFPYLLIEHGRKICKALKPDHANCLLRNICPSKEI